MLAALSQHLPVLGGGRTYIDGRRTSRQGTDTQTCPLPGRRTGNNPHSDSRAGAQRRERARKRYSPGSRHNDPQTVDRARIEDKGWTETKLLKAGSHAVLISSSPKHQMYFYRQGKETAEAEQVLHIQQRSRSITEFLNCLCLLQW